MQYPFKNISNYLIYSILAHNKFVLKLIIFTINNFLLLYTKIGCFCVVWVWWCTDTFLKCIKYLYSLGNFLIIWIICLIQIIVFYTLHILSSHIYWEPIHTTVNSLKIIMFHFIFIYQLMTTLHYYCHIQIQQT